MDKSELKVQRNLDFEMDFIEILNGLLSRKLMILGLTSFITIISSLFIYTTPSIYEANASVKLPNQNSVMTLNRFMGNTIYVEPDPLRKNEPSYWSIPETEKSIFYNFLNNIESQEIQKNAFVEGDFFSQINTDEINDKDAFISNFINSISVKKPKVTPDEVNSSSLMEKAYLVSIQNSNREILIPYLDSLILYAGKATLKDYLNRRNTKSEIRVYQILAEKEYHAEIEKGKLIHFEEQLEIAKSLGFKDNYIEKFSDSINFLPEEFFLYGSNVLETKIDQIKNRTQETTYNQKIINLNLEQKQIESLKNINLDNISAYQLTRSSEISTTNFNKNKYLILIFCFSLIFSIAIAILINLNKNRTVN